ncbi:zinc transporter 2-like isoform X2 [Ischnura elegans]|uniref:zinc transporter 2-like isoform X2 n=1 Tax=Ischnura elegans TaxID=197161 RepID=UPI001ED86D76|nr:zinc transporter 2-like isoform X2 [Ischnura elegans]XP_046383418.1 zinc transporter 2-like isoform X2 [Ischnura elegans]
MSTRSGIHEEVVGVYQIISATASNPSVAVVQPRYGGLTSNDAVLETPESNVQRLVFCVHGNPGGCCMLANGSDRCGPRVKVDGRSDDVILPNPDISADLGHCHQERSNAVDVNARRKLITASILCVLFMIGEIVGGVLSGSLAIATDAAHLLTDFASFMISLFSLWVASRPPSRTMSFGWYRAEVIGALTSVLMIWVVTGVLVYLAVERVIHKTFEIDATVMLITSGLGVVVNLIMGCTLHQHGHSHGGGGGHSHGSGSSHSHEPNINVRAAFIHVLGDFILSFGVFVAALIIYFKPSWAIVDPICTFLFSVLVLMTTITILRDVLIVLMEGMPKGVDFSQVHTTLLNIDGVVRVHNLRIWALSLDKTALSAHLAIRQNVNTQLVLAAASQEIRRSYNFFELTLQVEEFREEMEDCNQCQCPEG